MKQVLQIPADVGGYCREAAKVLESSARYLTREIDLMAEPDQEEWTVYLDSPEAIRLRDNVRKAAQWLDWLAQHGAHGEPVERVEKNDPAGLYRAAECYDAAKACSEAHIALQGAVESAVCNDDSTVELSVPQAAVLAHHMGKVTELLAYMADRFKAEADA